MALNKSNVIFASLMILVALFGVSFGGTMHKVGDSQGWAMTGVNYEAWSSSRTFQVGDTLVFEYTYEYHDVNEVTLNDFELCEPSKALARYETGSDTVNLTKPGVHNFICGFPDHCQAGQKLQILVLPASLGPVAAPVPGPVRSPSSSLSPSALGPVIDHAPQYQMGPAPAPQSVASSSSVWIGLGLFSLLCFFILV